jgi:hypothetical protein
MRQCVRALARAFMCMFVRVCACVYWVGGGSQIYTKDWSPRLPRAFLERVATTTAGFGGMPPLPAPSPPCPPAFSTPPLHSHTTPSPPLPYITPPHTHTSPLRHTNTRARIPRAPRRRRFNPASGG